MQVSFWLVLRRVNVGRIYSLIAKYLKFDWSIQGVGKLDSFEHIRWCSSAKAEKYSSCYLFWPCRSRWFIFPKQMIVLFWVMIYSYRPRSFKKGVLKTLYTIHRKATVSESLFNESATFLIKDSEIDTFLWILRNVS